MNEIQLSLCMIVRDEASNLPQCLASVRHFVDEQIVVDTGSRDRTLSIAQQFGARVYSFPWCDDFAVARNRSLSYAQGEWILVLDADEVLQPAIIPALKQAMQSSNTLVVNLLRQELGAQQVPYSLVSRLFRRRSDLQFTHPYHERIDDSITDILQREPHWRIEELPDVAIQHTGYQSEAIAQRQKLDRAQRVMQSYLATHPDDAYICNKLGALYAEAGDPTKGLELLQRGLRAAPTEPPLLYELHYHLGDTYRQMQQWESAARHFQAAAEQTIAPYLKLGAYTNWGSLLLEQGNPAGAKVLFEKTVQVDPSFALGHFNLGVALKTMGDLRSAIVHYQTAIRLNPDCAQAYQNLGVILLKVGRITDSMDAFRAAIALYEQRQSPEAAHIRQTLQELGFCV